MNPKKFSLGVFEGKLLGNNVSKDGAWVGLERVKGIKENPLPKNNQEIQSFNGINFVRCFIPNFAKIVRHISNMIKKGHDLRWSDEDKTTFTNIEHQLC